MQTPFPISVNMFSYNTVLINYKKPATGRLEYTI